jgi:tripartite-type tricarboxylate transporter receptor subunit TctC
VILVIAIQGKILGEETMICSRRSVLQSAVALPFVSALPRTSWGQAEDYPNREIHSICMFPAGTGADIIVRYYSRKLQELAGKPVIVENRIGAAGNNVRTKCHQCKIRRSARAGPSHS